jgi:hypothetical protein
MEIDLVPLCACEVTDLGDGRFRHWCPVCQRETIVRGPRHVRACRAGRLEAEGRRLEGSESLPEDSPLPAAGEGPRVRGQAYPIGSGSSTSGLQSPVSLPAKAARLTKAAARWIAAGRPLRTSERVEEIFQQHCQPCEHYRTKSDSCGACGCALRSLRVPAIGAELPGKLYMATERCPVKKF